MQVILDLEYRDGRKRRVYSFRGLKRGKERAVKIIAYGVRIDTQEYYILRNSISPEYVNEIYLH